MLQYTLQTYFLVPSSDNTICKIFITIFPILCLIVYPAFVAARDDTIHDEWQGMTVEVLIINYCLAANVSLFAFISSFQNFWLQQCYIYTTLFASLLVIFTHTVQLSHRYRYAADMLAKTLLAVGWCFCSKNENLEYYRLTPENFQFQKNCGFSKTLYIIIVHSM